MSGAPSPESWINDYLQRQQSALAAIPPAAVAELIGVLDAALERGATIFTFGNGGSASNVSHFTTDLGKSSSDAIGRRFRILSLNENVAWMTAIGNDYQYADIFVRQLENYAKPGDVAMALSVSGNSPNVVKALEYAKQAGLVTVALTAAGGGRAAETAKHCIRIADNHYGRVEDAQMTICHMLCYAFVEVGRPLS
jgi:D-sedoheptulose 7-phosphate isomerase